MSDLIRKDVNESLVEEIEALEAILSEEDELNLNLNSGSNDLQITTRITPLTGQLCSESLWLTVFIIFGPFFHPVIICTFQLHAYLAS